MGSQSEIPQDKNLTGQGGRGASGKSIEDCGPALLNAADDGPSTEDSTG